MATLSQLVTETTTIKNNLVSCHTNLKNNLTKKGVQCSSTDKLLSLANKVGEIELGKKWASGTATMTEISLGGTVNGTNAYGNFITVSNLGFKPSVIFIYPSPINTGTSFDFVTSCYIEKGMYNNAFQFSYTNSIIDRNEAVKNIDSFYWDTIKNNVYTKDGGFKMIVCIAGHGWYSNIKASWLAIE